MIMKRFRAHRHPLLLTCVIVLFFVSLLNITTSFAQDTPFARLKISYSSTPLLSLSPDGQTLATSGVGWWEVDLWDVATGKHLTTLNHPITINRLSTSESGMCFISFISDSTLLSATDTSSICLWDVSETFSFGTLLKREDVPGDEITSVILSPDGQTLAYSADNDWREKSVYLWDISDGTLLKEIRNCSDGLSLSTDGQTFSFSRDGQTFLTDCETTVSVWDVSDGTLLQSFDRGETASEMSAISPDGQTLVINKTYRGPAPTPRILELLDVSDGTLLKKFGIYYRYLTDISFSPDGQTLAVSQPGTVDLWDISTGALRNTFKHSGRPLRIVFSPDGKTLLSGLSTVSGGVSGLGLWDVATGRLRKVFQGSRDVRSISFIWDAQIPGGQILATAHKTISGGLYKQNVLEILLWRVGPEPAVSVGQETDREDGNVSEVGPEPAVSVGQESVETKSLVEPDDHSNIPAGATPIDINLGQATISFSRSSNGKIDYESDVDYFKIEVTSPGELTVYSKNSSIEMVGQLLDLNGDPVAADNSDGASQNFRIDYLVTDATLSNPKTYYVEVTAFHNNSTGDYRFYAELMSLKPDLVVKSTTVSPSVVMAGDPFTLTATFKNQGNATASAPIRYRWYRSTHLDIHNITNPVFEETSAEQTLTGYQQDFKHFNVALIKNEEKSETISLTAPQKPGTYYYSVCVTPLANESDQRNCSKSAKITVVNRTALNHKPKVHVIWYYAQNENKRGTSAPLTALAGLVPGEDYSWLYPQGNGDPGNVRDNLEDVCAFFTNQVGVTFDFERDTNNDIVVHGLKSDKFFVHYKD